MCIALLSTYVRAWFDEAELPRLPNGEDGHRYQPEHGTAYYENRHAPEYGVMPIRDHRPAADPATPV